MAEVKNTFINSKMNLDLDDRLIPNGQYRQAFNIAVGRSEDGDVGALENVPGNVLLFGTNLRDQLDNPNIDCVGVIADSNNNRIILFLTDWSNDIDHLAPSTAFCAIYVYNASSSGANYLPLVIGSFLNFSKLYPVQGINLIEDLLFWTDNRNQPRKINTTTALNNFSYYTSEVQISVAKYNPYETINLIKSASTTIDNPAAFTTVFEVADTLGIELGMTLLCNPKIDGSDYIFVTTIDTLNNIVTIDSAPTNALANGDKLVFLSSTMTNQESIPTWPGDPDYLQSRYVRFGYRFKFDDSEYSITSPFTQIAYIPEQKGFFVSGDEDAAYRSTVLNFMQNNVQNVELLIPLPDKLNNISMSYKIIEIDVLYKQADQTTIKVLDTIVISEVDPAEGDSSVFAYNYQSRKPYKTLPEAQTVRVYDKVPTRAFAQETSGNRIIYGNYKDVYTPPNNINYTVAVVPKVNNYASNFDSFIEYPNHTLKENRNYQVGFVLSDKYGRQSPVILSSIKDFKTSDIYGGSTVYSPYKSFGGQPNLNEWVGDALQVSVNAPISSGLNGSPIFSTGEPGLYAIPTGVNQSGFSISSGTVVANTYSFTQDGSTANNNVPVVGDYLRGQYKDYVQVTSVSLLIPDYTLIANGPISHTYNHDSSVAKDTKFSYKINEIGWYSYKVVVKQTEQDYYNCYLPGMLNGYPVAESPTPAFPSNEAGKTAHIVLLNDNINKIPRDLSEVGPDQKQYRSSVVLYGRVQNTSIGNTQYYPGRLFDIVSTIANATELDMDTAKLTLASQVNIYQVNTKPIIGRVSTSQATGITTATMIPFLSIYETKPVESLLTIYWETSTNGLLSDLNENILTGFEGPYAFSEIAYLQTEDKNPANETDIDPANKWVTDLFVVKSKEGATLSTINVTSFSVKNGNGETVTSMFGWEKNISAQLRIKILQPFAYLHDSHNRDVFIFSFTIDYTQPGPGGEVFTNTLTTSGALTNNDPSFTDGQVFYVDRMTDTVGAVLGGVNGSFDIINKGTEVYWTLNSVSGPVIDPAPFSVGSGTGVISQTALSARAFGKYVLNISVYDATQSDGSRGVGSLSYTGTVEVTIGETPLNSNVPNSTSRPFCNSTSYYGPSGRLAIAPAGALGVTNSGAAWFIGDSNINTTTLPSEWTTIVSAGKNLNVTPYVMGGSVTQGTLALTLLSQINSPVSGFYTIGNFKFKIFHRTNSSFPWSESFKDINNTDFNGQVEQFEVNRYGTVVTKIVAITRAFDLIGEYFVLAYGINTVSSAGANDTMRMWVNAFDLFYPNVTTPVGASTSCVGGGSVNYFKYDLSLSENYSNCALAGNSQMYSNTPYIQYARSFFQNTLLSVPINAPLWLSTTPDLYYTIDFVFPIGSGQVPTPAKATLRIDANGNKIQTGSTTYTSLCGTSSDYVIVTSYEASPAPPY